MTITTAVYNDPRELTRIVEPWRDLFEASRPPWVFQHPDWVLPWMAALGRDTIPNVVAASLNGSLVGLALLTVTVGASERVATFAGCPLNDFNDFLVSGFGRRSVVDALWRAIVADAGWDRLLLEPIHPTSLSLALSGLPPEGVRIERRDGDLAPEVDVGPSWGRFWGSLANHHRQAHERSLARLCAAHAVSLDVVAEPSRLEGEIDEFLALRLRSWSGRGRIEDLPAVERDARFAFFLRRAGARLAASRRCYLLNLEVDGVVAAQDLYLVNATAALLYLRSYHEEFAHLSPGTCLALLGLNFWHGRGIRTVQLGRGDELYKHRLGGRGVVLQEADVRRTG